MPSEWLPYLQGNEIEFKTKDDAEFVFSFLLKFYNRIAEEILTGKLYPLLPEVEDESGVHLVARNWCGGFLFATSLYREEYLKYLEEDNDCLMDALILNYLAEGGETDNPVVQKIVNSLGKSEMELIDLIPGIVWNMYDFFQEKYYDENSHEDEFDDIEEKIKPIKKATPKIGRNDPCPCGSGKKYKHCCGKAV